ncbi:DNA repair protein RecO [Macrococcus capreoli]|uniref:DNA repair protein RecO n=1 Tax=Macrococcus capreoli TaxID=2982690 RepID=UPI0021D5E844|nr:DNA repair protein RecO [Macrococcus sp. TMW 2.2395]MCU7556871.1 DNA repair protein RecO [Macrococcus sp. TMW 2.2395]
MLKKSVGIVIKRVEYGDNHLIITFLNEAGVKVAVMARNARKSTKFGAGLDLFYENLFIFSQFKGMGTLSSVDTIESHYPIRSDIMRLSYAQYIVELIDRGLDDDATNKLVYQLLKFGLDRISIGDNEALIALFVSLKMMPLYGYEPNFKYSAHDGAMDHKDFVAYSFKYNSVITHFGLEEDPHAIRMSNKALYMLYLLDEVPLEKVSGMKISVALVSEMESLVFKMYDEFIGVYLKSRKIIEQLNNMNSQ